MPNTEKVVTVKPLLTFPYELYNGFKYYFLKGKDTEVTERIATELCDKKFAERVYVNKSEGQSIHAYLTDRASNGAGNTDGVKGAVKDRKK